jgi:hypothetical protein
MENKTARFILSAPKLSGFRQEFDNLVDATEKAVELLGTEDVTRTYSTDGTVEYLYASQEKCDADQDGSYAVQIEDTTDHGAERIRLLWLSR